MKRFLALVIAIILVMGVLPTTFAAETTGNGNEWIFTSGSHNLSGEQRMFVAAVTDSETGNVTPAHSLHTLNLTDTVVSDKWEFANQMGSSAYHTYDDYLLWSSSQAAIQIPDYETATDGLNALVLEIIPDTAGEFSPCLSYISNTTSAIYEVFFFEKPNGSGLCWEWETESQPGQRGSRRSMLAYLKANPQQRIGKFDAYGSNKLELVSFPKVAVEADKSYYLVLVSNGASEACIAAKGDSDKTSLKLVSFAMKDSTVATTPFYKYDISKNALSDTFTTDYADALSKYSNLTSNGMLRYISWEETISGITPAIDTTKTDGFATLGRSNTLDISPGLYDDGFAAGLTIGTYSTDTSSATLNYTNDMGTRAFCLIKINVPVGGRYIFTALNAFTAKTAESTIDKSSSENNAVIEGAVPTVHMIKADIGLTYVRAGMGSDNRINNAGALGFSSSTVIGSYDSGKLTTDKNNPVRTDIGTVELEVGEYYVLFDIDSTAISKNSTYWIHGTNARQLFLLSGIELTPVEPTVTEQEAAQEEYEAIVNETGSPAEEVMPVTGSKSFVKILSSKDDKVLYNEEHAAGDTVTYTATGDDFLYWAQGLEYKTVISEDATLSITAEKGAMYIYAVYAKGEDTTEVVFYNGNKAEISRKSYTQGDEIAMEALPSMAGFKDAASAWTCVEDGKEYTAENPATASGKLMRFVAKYPDVADETFTVTVTNGTADKTTVTYGEQVTVTAPVRKDNTSTLLFNYWEKDGKIVSFDESYSFRVYKDTTVIAVYKEYQPLAESVRKIILGTRNVGTETAVIAEFINVTDVVEKGIMFGGTSLDDATYKVAMKGTDNFFSVIDDVTGDAKGYAILKNGNVIYSE